MENDAFMAGEFIQVSTTMTFSVPARMWHCRCVLGFQRQQQTAGEGGGEGEDFLYVECFSLGGKFSKRPRHFATTGRQSAATFFHLGFCPAKQRASGCDE